MTLKGKKKKLLALGALMAVMAMLLFSPEEEEAGQGEGAPHVPADALHSGPQDESAEEDLQYMKQYAWHADDGDERYWLLISEKELPEGGKSCFALTYTEHTDVGIEGGDLTGRFTDTEYYESITADRGKLTLRSRDGKTVNGAYKTDPQERTITIYLTSGEGDGDMAVFHGVSFDELIYPTV